MRQFVSIVIMLAAALCFASHAQKGMQVVSGEYTFYGSREHSPEQAKRHALEGARVAALADAFGTNVSSTVWQQTTEATEMFDLLSSTEVRGIWIEDVGEPAYEVTLGNDGALVVKCKVKGRAQAISNEATEFAATTLRNGLADRMESTTFNSGDQMYLKFTAPTDGYVAAYMACPDMYAHTLLPYPETPNGQIKVKSGKTYIFFHPTNELNSLYGTAEEIILGAPQGETELNRLYVIFSPKPFSKAIDEYVADTMPRRLSFKEFAHWLDKARRNDSLMGVKILNLEIKGE